MAVNCSHIKTDSHKAHHLKELHCLTEKKKKHPLPKKSVLYFSVQFSHSVMSDSLQPHELQHARPPSPSPTPRVYPNPCPSSR